MESAAKNRTTGLPGASATKVSAASSRLLNIASLAAWGKKSAMSLLDQGLTAGAGFGVNVFLARFLPAGEYGAFAVAFAAFLFASGFHNVLLHEPMTVFGPARYADALRGYFRNQLVVHGVLVGPLSAVVIAGGLSMRWIAPSSSLANAVIGGGICLPFLLLLWLLRRMCYVVQRPAMATTGSALYLGIVLCGLFLLRRFGLLGAFTAFSMMGLAGVVSAGALAKQLDLFGPSSDRRSSPEWRATLRENWVYGRWLVGSTALFSVSSQIQMFLAAGTLGLGAAGVLRAMQIPALAMTQVVTATSLLVLPALSYDFGRGSLGQLRNKALLVSAALFALALFFAGLIGAGALRLDRLLFGGKYADFVWLMPVLALVPAVNSVSMGYSLALRAAQQPRFDLISNLVAAPVAVLSALIFMPRWRLAGAAASMLLGYAALSLVTILCFRNWLREQSFEPRTVRNTPTPEPLRERT